MWAAHAIGRVPRAGVTSIAVPGGKWFTDVTVREAVEAGLLEGPRMVVAARALSNYAGIFYPDPYPAYEGSPADAAGVLCNTRDAFIRETRKQCRRGVDLIKIADSTWGDVQTVAEDEISAVVDEAHRHNVKVAIHSRGSTSTRAAAGVDLIYHADLATEEDLDIVSKAGIPIAPVLTSPWIGFEHGAAARGFGDQVRDRPRRQLEKSFQMIRDARARGIVILSGSDSGNASAFAHGRWHGKEAELIGCRQIQHSTKLERTAIYASPPRRSIIADIDDIRHDAARHCGDFLLSHRGKRYDAILDWLPLAFL